MTMSFSAGGGQAGNITPVQAAVMTKPEPPTLNVVAAGVATVGYKIVAFNANNVDGVPSTESTTALANATTDIILTWPAVQGAAGYRIIRSTGGPSQGSIATVANDTLTYEDVNQAAVAYTAKLSNPQIVVPTYAAPVRGTLTDRSSTVATGGTSQQLMAANPARNYLFVENGKAQTESLFISFTAAASTSTTGGSIEIAPGGSYVMESSYISTEQVNVNAATNGHPYIAKEG
jgi:hypothetical protein